MGQYKCPYCPSRETKVRETRTKVPFERVRICPKCGTRFITIEVHVQTDGEDYINTVARMASEQLFNRFLSVLALTPVRKAVVAQMERKAGLRKGPIKRPADLLE